MLLLLCVFCALLPRFSVVVRCVAWANSLSLCSSSRRSKKKSLWEYFYENLHLRCLRVLRLHFSFSFSYICIQAFNVHSTWVVVQTKGNTRVCWECFLFCTEQHSRRNLWTFFFSASKLDFSNISLFWIDSLRNCHNICRRSYGRCNCADDLSNHKFQWALFTLLSAAIWVEEFIRWTSSSVRGSWLMHNPGRRRPPICQWAHALSECLLHWSSLLCWFVQK